MKTRIISAVVGLILLAAFLMFYDYLVVVRFVVAILALIGVDEALNAAGILKQHKPVAGLCRAFAVALILFTPSVRIITLMIYVMTIAVFAYTLMHHKTFTVREGAYSLMMGVGLPAVFSLLLQMPKQMGAQQGVLYLFFLLGSAWWSDTGAYFAGTFFGKHKLCPEISPKKTVEGLIGGLATAVLGNIAVAALFAYLSKIGVGYLSTPMQPDYLAIVLLSLPLSALSVVGDLSFSIIKRTYGIKDYGNIMPGHGGVLDRFDSVLFITPAVYFISQFYPIANLV